jgi:hypothetical protein
MNVANFLQHPRPYFDLGLYRISQRSQLLFLLYLTRIALSGFGKAGTRQLSKTAMELLDALHRDGIVVVPDFLSRDECATILAETEDELIEGESGRPAQRPGTKFAYLPQYRTTRVIGLETVSATAATQFSRNAMLEDLACAYSGGAAPLFQSFVERKSAAPEVGELETWHFDGVDKRFKAFVYLADVTERNGPFEYLRGSHRLDAWKFRRFYRWHKTRGPIPRSGDLYDNSHFLGAEGDEVLARYRRLTVTGTAGTMFLFDGRGIHRGRTLDEGTRLVMANYYRAQNF